MTCFSTKWFKTSSKWSTRTFYKNKDSRGHLRRVRSYVRGRWVFSLPFAWNKAEKRRKNTSVTKQPYGLLTFDICAPRWISCPKKVVIAIYRLCCIGFFKQLQWGFLWIEKIWARWALTSCKWSMTSRGPPCRSRWSLFGINLSRKRPSKKTLINRDDRISLDPSSTILQYSACMLCFL